DEAQVVDRVFHPDKSSGLGPKLLERIDGDAHRGTARYVVHHPRQVADLRELEKVSDQTALRRAAVGGGDNKERVGSGTGGVLGESARLRQRLRAGCRDYGDALGTGVDRYIHWPVTLV